MSLTSTTKVISVFTCWSLASENVRQASGFHPEKGKDRELVLAFCPSYRDTGDDDGTKDLIPGGYKSNLGTHTVVTPMTPAIKAKCIDDLRSKIEQLQAALAVAVEKNDAVATLHNTAELEWYAKYRDGEAFEYLVQFGNRRWMSANVAGPLTMRKFSDYGVESSNDLFVSIKNQPPIFQTELLVEVRTFKDEADRIKSQFQENDLNCSTG